MEFSLAGWRTFLVHVLLNLGVGGGSGAPLTLGATGTDSEDPRIVMLLALCCSHFPPKHP